MNDVRPYVDRPVTDRERAGQVARRWADTWELPTPRVLRHGMNSLYACGGVVLRIGASTAPAAASHELVGWLLDAGVPTVHPVHGLTADDDGLAVTGWEMVRQSRQAVDWEAVGAAVALVHSLPVDEVPDSYPLPDPTSFPWWGFEEMLDDIADEIDAEALDGLRAALDRHPDWRDRVRADAVLCHGDVHPGNVLTSGSGMLLVDWDLMCVANPAWDHAMLAVSADRWGRDPADYRRFVAGYGSDADGDLAHLASELGELRNVAATVMRVRAGRTDEAARAEAERRLRFWRGDPSAPVWAAQ